MKSGWLDSLLPVGLLDNLMACTTSCKSRHVLLCLTTAGPTLRVFKLLRRKCCLCNDIYKCLDFLVFLNKDEKL